MGVRDGSRRGVDWGGAGGVGFVAEVANVRRRRKLELLLQDIRRALDTRNPDPDNFALWSSVSDVGMFRKELAVSVAKVGQVLELAMQLRAASMLRCQVAEEAMLIALRGISNQASAVLEEAGFGRVDGWPDPDPVQYPEPYQSVMVLRAIHDFALDCMDFSRPRDSFGGRRRGFCFGILGCVASLVELPAALSFANQALRKKSSSEAGAAADFIKTYYSIREELPDESTVAGLRSLAEKAMHRSIAWSALDALVEIGVIGEAEALQRMDDWNREP